MANLGTRITAQLDGFNKKLASLIAVTGRELASELNRQMLQVVVGAKGVQGLVQLTKKATEARIRADLAKVVTYRAGSKQVHTGALSRVLAIQWMRRLGIKDFRGQIASYEQRIIKARIQSRAYIAASWLWSAQALARFVPGNTLTRLRDNQIPLKADGSAHLSFDATIPAREGSLRVTVFNTARGAKQVAAKAIPRALGNARRSMGKYISRQLGKKYALANPR